MMEHIFFLVQTTLRNIEKINFCEPQTLNFQISSNMGTVSYTVPSKVAQYVIQRHPDISIYNASYIWMPLQIAPYTILSYNI